MRRLALRFFLLLPRCLDRFRRVYEVRPRKDKRGFDLISDALPFGQAVVRRAKRDR